MEQQIFERIKEFTAKETGIKVSKIMPSCTLEMDLGISGDDAAEYLLAFSKEFKVDLSDFDIQKYFYSEVDTLFPKIVIELLGKKMSKQKELTINALVKAAMLGKLNDDVIDLGNL